MDRGMVLFLGCFLTFTSSWLGLVFAPLVKVNQMQPVVVDETTNDVYPKPMSGAVADGFAVYKANGCLYCHSQQIRDESFGNNTDILRGWAIAALIHAITCSTGRSCSVRCVPVRI